MRKETTQRRSWIALGVLILVIGAASTAWANSGSDADASSASRGTAFVVESALLKGLAPGALYPFVDTTPGTVTRAHIAITDSASDCSAGASAPDNIVILVGQAGVALESAATAATNTGIGSSGQCVFHVTVEPGKNGMPDAITDIVVVNGGSSKLTGRQTVTVSATVTGY